jgi:hypothetical protein
MKIECLVTDKNNNKYITFANDYKEAENSKGRLWNFKRTISGDDYIIRSQFYIKAKSLEEAEEMLGDWDNYSLIDEAMNLSKEDKKIYENMEVDDDEIWTDDNNEYNQTHTAEKPIPLYKLTKGEKK